MEQFQNYIKEKRGINIGRMQIFSLIISLVFIVLYGVAFANYGDNTLSFLNLFAGKSVISIILLFAKFFLMIAIGICLHELVHGILFALYAKGGFKSIRFGILTNPVFAFYCHCKEPIKVHQYMVVAIMPLFLTGILPSAIAIVLGDVVLLLTGFILTVGAVGDIMMIQMLWKEDRNSYVLDHPSEIGFYILKEKNIEV